MLKFKFTCRSTEGWLGPGTSGKEDVYQSLKLMWKKERGVPMKGGSHEGAVKHLTKQVNDTIRYTELGSMVCLTKELEREELAKLLEARMMFS